MLAHHLWTSGGSEKAPRNPFVMQLLLKQFSYAKTNDAHDRKHYAPEDISGDRFT